MKQIFFAAMLALIFSSLPGKLFAEYYASTGSDRYHKPSCRFVKRIAPANRLTLKDRKSAWDKGYKPCETCRPEGYDQAPAKKQDKKTRH